MKRIVLIISFFLLVGYGNRLSAQEIAFHTYTDYGIKIGTDIQQIDFNQLGPIVSGNGQYHISLSDQVGIVPIIAIKYLDIIVEVIADEYLSNGSDKIPFTLEASYSNNTGNPIKSYAKPISIINNTFTIRIPMLERQNQPPGPPPTPPTKATDLTVSTNNPLFEVVHLYLYGSIDVGNISSGNYLGNISINVSYE